MTNLRVWCPLCGDELEREIDEYAHQDYYNCDKCWNTYIPDHKNCWLCDKFKVEKKENEDDRVSN